MEGRKGCAVGTQVGSASLPGLLGFLEPPLLPADPGLGQLGPVNQFSGSPYPPRPEAFPQPWAPGCQLLLWARSGMKCSSWDERLAGLGWASNLPHPRWEDLWAPM